MSDDAALLRAAASVIEVQATTRGLPHLVALANRLLTLADQLAPEPTPDTDDQEDQA